MDPKRRLLQAGLAVAVLPAIFVIAFPSVAAPQEGAQLRSRQLWNAELMGSPPAQEKEKPARPVSQRPQRPVYETKAAEPAPLQQSDAIVGVTIWKLRVASPSDNDKAILEVAEEGGKVKYAPVRVAAGTPLAAGEKVRLSIEAPREGYLYVVNREEYLDGTMSEPYLIFPTLRTRSGDNRVQAGRVIEIPDQKDNPPYFTLRPQRPEQTAEVLVVLVAPEPMTELKIGRSAMKLSDEQVAEWEAKWGAEAERFELAGGVGRPWTPAEKEAGLGSRLLVQDEPMPQTLYRVPAKPGQPVMLKVPLRIEE